MSINDITFFFKYNRRFLSSFAPRQAKTCLERVQTEKTLTSLLIKATILEKSGKCQTDGQIIAPSYESYGENTVLNWSVPRGKSIANLSRGS